VFHTGLRSSSLIVSPHGRAFLARRFLSVEREQINNLHLQRRGKIFQPGHGRRIDAALDQADEFHRATGFFRKLFLRQLPCLAQVGDPLAKLFLKHGVGLSQTEANGNGAKLRAAVSASADDCATATKIGREMVSPYH